LPKKKSGREKILVLGNGIVPEYFAWEHAAYPDVVFGGGADFWFRRHNYLALALYRSGCLTQERIVAWYAKRNCKKYSKIIFFAYFDKQAFLNPAYLKNKRRNTYVWFWDPVRDEMLGSDFVEQCRRCHHLYSFQAEDCARYRMHFNTTLYLPPEDIEAFMPRAAPLYDALFLGSDKGRGSVLRACYEQMASLGLRPFIYLHIKGRREESAGGGWLETGKAIPYRKYLQDYVAKTRAIMDICQEGQTGFSLRVMEHLFFDKKLITNNAAIKDARFYHADNIFLLGKDDMGKMEKWLALPFVPIAREIKDGYRFENWVKRFARE